MVGGKEAMKLRGEILDQLETIAEVAGRMDGTHGTASGLRTESAAADKDFKSAVDGMVAVMNLAAPKLGALLPTRSSNAGVDDDAFAEAVAKTLESGGAKPFAAMLLRAKDRRLDLARKYAAAAVEGKASSTHSTVTEVAQLNLLLQQAAVLVRRAVPPGSPILKLLVVTGGNRPKKKEPPATTGDAPGVAAVAPSAPISGPNASPVAVMNGAAH